MYDGVAQNKFSARIYITGIKAHIQTLMMITRKLNYMRPKGIFCDGPRAISPTNAFTAYAYRFGSLLLFTTDDSVLPNLERS